MRLPLLIAGVFGVYEFWPYIQADERLMGAALVPAAYFIGMWALSSSDS